jgi:S1-C subfamily serine protease
LLLLGLAVIAGSLAVLPATLHGGTPSAQAEVDGDNRVEVLGAVEQRPLATVPVVRVIASGCGGRSVGSGVLLDGGRVLTARHVLDGASSATVDIDGRRVTARLIALDGNGRDAALLDVAGLDLAGTVIADDRPTPGEHVRVLGHPRGGALEERRGALLGSLDVGPLALDGGRVLTLDLVVTEGMSGGPVVDATGAVVGVAVGYEANTRTGIAVPADELTALVDGRGVPTQPAC